MAMSQSLLLGVVLGIPLLCTCISTTYYVVPIDHPSACPEVGDKCHTLGYYASNSTAYFTSDTTMIFLKGCHLLNTTIQIQHVKSLHLVGNETTVSGSHGLHVPSSQIFCTNNTVVGNNSKGFVFNFVHNLTIRNLLFSRCGKADRHVEHNVNISTSTLEFHESYDVNITGIVIQNSSGYGLFGHNILGVSSIENSTIMSTIGNGLGGNAYFHYENCSASAKNSQLMNIHSSRFLYGSNFYCSSCRSAYCRATGLTFIIGSNCPVLTINIQSMTADGNRGCFGGNMAVLYQALHLDSQVINIRNSNFSNGIAYYGGGGVNVESLLQFSNVMPQLLQFYTCSFVNNTGTGLLLGTLCSLSFFGSNIFKYNSGLSGGAMVFSPGSHMLIHSHTSLHFIENHAALAGGAIWAPTQHAGIPFCFYRPVFTHTSYGVDVHLTFQGNTATFAGDALYGGSVEYCRIVSTSRWQEVHGLTVFKRIFDVHNDRKHVSQVSSDPNGVCLCEDGYLDCNKTERRLSIFPGESFQLSAITVGQLNGTVPGSISASVHDGCAQLQSLQASQIVASCRSCTNLTYTVFSDASHCTLELGVLDSNATSAVGVSSYPFKTVMLRIDIKPCPPGFRLSRESFKYLCDCDPVLAHHGISCNITAQKVQRPPQAWIAYYNATTSNDSGVVFSANCPFDYCNSSMIGIDLREPAAAQCAPHRDGTLCGACKSGYSLALGTTQCVKCNNKYLALLVPFCLVGIVLVVFLFLFNWTVPEGTVNGIIFYANVVWVNRTTFYPDEETGVFTVFTAWLNLDLGVQTCFYDGMDTYAKVWLQFAFPLYIWMIVIAIIATSHRYSKITNIIGNNAVKVLATLFLLSYAKLQRTVTAALSVTSLKYPNSQVKWLWKYDPNIEYFSVKHAPLFIVALLVILVLMLPYILLLLGIQVLRKAGGNHRRCSLWLAKLHPLFDAYTAPLKPTHQFWIGFVLLIRSVLLVVSAVNHSGYPSMNLLSISIAILFVLTLAWMLGGVYKSWVINTLEASFLLNLGIFAVGTFYITSRGGSQAALAYCSVGLVLAEFIGILFYHALLRTRLGRWCVRKICSGLMQRNRDGFEASVPLLSDVDVKHDSQFREPLFEYLSDSDS